MLWQVGSASIKYRTFPRKTLLTVRALSVPHRVREVGSPCPPENRFSGQRRITAAFGYSAPHPSARGTLTLLNSALLSAHYGSARLPEFVHHRLLSLNFPMRPARAGRSRANPGPRNFRSRCVPTCQGHRRAQDSGQRGLRWRTIGCCLPLRVRASAS